MYQIVKNISLPARSNARYEYPLDDLDVNDGFDALDDLGVYPSGGSRRVANIRNAIAAKRRKSPGWNAKIRIVPGTELVRVVRVA